MRSVAGLLLAAAVGMGCGGGAASDVAPSVHADSFSPVTGTTATGDVAPELWWRHSLNGGIAMAITVNGTPGSLTYGDRLTRVVDGGTRRLTTLDATLVVGTGAERLASHVTTSSEETLAVGPPSTIVSQTLNQDQQTSGMGMSLHLLITIMAMSATPQVDFGDRPDLDQLPVGHVDETTTQSTFTSTATSPGTDPVSITGRSNDHTQFKILERMSSFTMHGTTYPRVVKVQFQIDSTDLDTGTATSVTNNYWLAAGIGVVHAEQHNTVTGMLINVQLLDTNLGLP